MFSAQVGVHQLSALGNFQGLRWGPAFSHSALLGEESCFTQGLVLNGSGEVFESCGLYDRSYLRHYNLESGQTLKRTNLPSELFAEGAVLTGGKLYMLTWREKVLKEYNAADFGLLRTHEFPYGEGWGIAWDGCDLLIVTGKTFMLRLRPEPSGDLTYVSKIEVTYNGAPVSMLNEMEYVTPKVWVNQWQTNFMYRVNPWTGVAERRLSVKGLYKWSREKTPNGIAYSPHFAPDKLLVTGKLWSEMFLLRVSQEDLCGATVGGADARAAAPSCASAPLSACWGLSLPAPLWRAAAPPAGPDPKKQR